MVFLYILFSFVLFFGVLVGVSKLKLFAKSPLQGPSVYDTMIIDYIMVVNAFIRREFTSYLHGRMQMHASDSSKGVLKYFEVLKTREEFTALITSATALIVTRMSPEIKKAFSRVYAIDYLTEYIENWCIARVRELTFDVSVLIHNSGDALDISDKVLLNIEMEVYKAMGLTKDDTLTLQERK